MISFLQTLGKSIFRRKRIVIGSKRHKKQCDLFSKLKECSYCKKPYWRKNKKGEDYKLGWVLCDTCGTVYCVECMVFPRGFGTCPNCPDKVVAKYDKYIEKNKAKEDEKLE